MKKIIDWFKESNRWKHLFGGLIIGFASNDIYCAALANASTAAALELKDWEWAKNIDVIDFAVTILGGAIGFGLHMILFN